MEISNLTYPPTYLTYQGICTRGCNFSPVPPSRRPRMDVRAGKLRVRGKAAGTRGVAAAAYPSFKHNMIYMLEIPIGLYSIYVCVLCIWWDVAARGVQEGGRRELIIRSPVTSVTHDKTPRPVLINNNIHIRILQVHPILLGKSERRRRYYIIIIIIINVYNNIYVY